MDIPQVLGYARIAGAPLVTGLYTVLLPLVGFAVYRVTQSSQQAPYCCTPNRSDPV
jgi:MFS superfamily sulfate permease-like transporter